MNELIRKGEYKYKGDYHKKIDKKWRYYPVYIEKINFIEKFLNKISKNKRILDIGCGEGVLVEKFRKKGHNIIGIDSNYSSKQVIKRDILNMKFKDREFDVILCLDVLEHLNFEEQERAIKEIHRVLKNKGTLLLTLPNLAHFASRISFLFIGKLLRTSTIDRHKGDRPIKEYIKLFKKNNFKIIKVKGIFPTYPFSAILTYFFPDKVLLLHKFLNKFLAYPHWCFLNIFILKKINL